MNYNIYMDQCIFCKIVAGEIPAKKIYEDQNIIAFLDIMPINKGHVVIATKKHYQDVTETPENELTNLINTAKKIGMLSLNKLKADGFNIGVNTKTAAGQAVMHIHFHVIPRYLNDGLKHWPQQKTTNEELEETAKIYH